MRFQRDSRHLARSGDPKIEAIWRIAGAFGYTLWIPIPLEAEHLLADQLRILELSDDLAIKILEGLRSRLTEKRIRTVEIIRDLFRYERPDQPNSATPKETAAQIANEIIHLQPNFFGIGINLNAIIKRWLRSPKNVNGQ
jgi:hypothetical protein